MRMIDAKAAPPIQPGEAELSVQIPVVWELVDRKP